MFFIAAQVNKGKGKEIEEKGGVFCILKCELIICIVNTENPDHSAVELLRVSKQSILKMLPDGLTKQRHLHLCWD